MSDLAAWKVHGPVSSVRIERAEWDLAEEEWRVARGLSVAQFLRNGGLSQTEHCNPDGSVSRTSRLYDAAGRFTEVRSDMNGGHPLRRIYSYDGADRLTRVAQLDPDGATRDVEAYSYRADGRKTRVQFLWAPKPNVQIGWGIEGTDQIYSASGAATVTTGYDGRGQPDEVLFHDSGQRLLRRVSFQRNSEGRLEREEMCNGESALYSDADLASASPEARKMIATMLGGGAVISSVTYAYDEKGRLSERRSNMGQLGEVRRPSLTTTATIRRWKVSQRSQVK